MGGMGLNGFEWNELNGGGTMKQGKNETMKGSTLTEIILVSAITLVLLAISGVGISGYMKKSKVDVMQTEQTIFATDFEDILVNKGVLKLSKTDKKKERLVKEWLTEVQAEYMHCNLDFKSLVMTDGGFEVETLDAVDPWGQVYLIVYCTEASSAGKDKDKGATPGDTMIISGGENMTIEREGYASLIFSDDKVLLVDANVE